MNVCNVKDFHKKNSVRIINQTLNFITRTKRMQLFVAIFLVSFAKGQPTPFIPLTSYSVLIGNDVQIPCTVSANQAATLIQWQFTSNSGSSTPISQSTTKYTLVSDSTTTSNLTIRSAALTDAGTYRCSATNIAGTGSDSATLTITGIFQDAATVTVSPPSQSVLQKSTAIIQCIINNANPGVTEVLWEKISSGTTSSVIVTGRFNGSTPSLPNLIISDLQPSDAGTYYCSARNGIGTSRSSTGSNLIVTGAVPYNVQILGATSQIVNLGGSLTLQCSGQGDPAPTLSWIFSSSTSDATTVGTGTTYSITNAQRTNGGTYVCRGTNSLGSIDSQGVTVDVQYAPIDARTDAQKSLSAAVGSIVSLVCAVDANPVASYEWYRSNQLVSYQREYTFALSSLALLGSYTCKATNSRGSLELPYTLSEGIAGQLTLCAQSSLPIPVATMCKPTTVIGNHVVIDVTHAGERMAKGINTCTCYLTPVITKEKARLYVLKQSSLEPGYNGCGSRVDVIIDSTQESGVIRNVCFLNGNVELKNNTTGNISFVREFYPHDDRYCIGLRSDDSNAKLQVQCFAPGEEMSFPTPLAPVSTTKATVFLTEITTKSIGALVKETQSSQKQPSTTIGHIPKTTPVTNKEQLDTDSKNAAIIATSVILPVIIFVLLVLALMIFVRRKRRKSSQNTSKQKYIPSVDKLVQESAKENRDILNVCHSKKDSIYDTIEDEEGYLKSFPVRKICNLPYTKSPTSLVPSKEEDDNISNEYSIILE